MYKDLYNVSLSSIIYYNKNLEVTKMSRIRRMSDKLWRILQSVTWVLESPHVCEDMEIQIYTKILEVFQKF